MNLDTAFEHLYKTYFGDLQIEREEIENLPNLLTDCDIFIDVGASLGMYTYYANRILEEASIIAIEGDPDRYEELRKNCLKWAPERSNTIIALNKVIGESQGTCTFYKTGTNISGGLFPVDERSDRYEAVTVPQVTLDEYYVSGKRTVVKIDVEGSEYRVMQGATKHLENKHTGFLIEMHWWGDRERGTTSLDLLRFMYSNAMSIRKTVRPHTSNYFFRPAKFGERLLPSYIRCAPLLMAKTFYGTFVPASVRNLREEVLNRRRRRKYGAPLES